MPCQAAAAVRDSQIRGPRTRSASPAPVQAQGHAQPPLWSAHRRTPRAACAAAPRPPLTWAPSTPSANSVCCQPFLPSNPAARATHAQATAPTSAHHRQLPRAPVAARHTRPPAHPGLTVVVVESRRLARIHVGHHHMRQVPRGAQARAAAHHGGALQLADVGRGEEECVELPALEVVAAAGSRAQRRVCRMREPVGHIEGRWMVSAQSNAGVRTLMPACDEVQASGSGSAQVRGHAEAARLTWTPGCAILHHTTEEEGRGHGVRRQVSLAQASRLSSRPSSDHARTSLPFTASQPTCVALTAEHSDGNIRVRARAAHVAGVGRAERRSRPQGRGWFK
jgi:hypothetical protein